MMMRILVIAAHPDDEVLGCGGTIARLAREGYETYIAILGEGITSRYKKREHADRRIVEVLHDRSHEVAKLLGVKNLFVYDLPDNRFDTLPLLDVIKLIEELIRRLQPQVIYTHHGGDLNIDHVVVHRAVLTATRPTTDQPVQEIYTFYIPSSTEWSFQQFGCNFHPNIFIDIENTLEIKIKAISCYETEVRMFPHPRSPEAIRATAQWWGSVVGRGAVEAFELIRSIR